MGKNRSPVSLWFGLGKEVKQSIYVFLVSVVHTEEKHLKWEVFEEWDPMVNLCGLVSVWLVELLHSQGGKDCRTFSFPKATHFWNRN